MAIPRDDGLVATQWILKVLASADRPMSVSELADAIAAQGGPTLGPRQVAYRIQQAPDRVELAGGKNRGARYRLRNELAGGAMPPLGQAAGRSQPKPTEPPMRWRVSESDRESAGLLLSTLSLDLSDRLTRHLSERQPVGFNRDWLDAYVPGKTWYLPEPLREELHALGTPAAPDRPAGTFARDILERLLIDLSWASSRLEGNTYSRLDTQNLVEFGIAAEGKDAFETRMIINHKNAIQLLVSEDTRVGLNAFTVRSLHAALAADLLPDPRNEGRLRRTEVRITSSVYWPTAVPQVIEDCFTQIIETAAAIPDPLEASFFLLVHLPYLQPFIDVNKRTARLAANLPLVAANLCPHSFVDVPEREYVLGHLAVYELNRVELLREVFAWAYARSCLQYRLIQDAVVPPNPIRLRHRDALARAISGIVRGGNPPSRSLIREAAEQLPVPAADLDAFTETVLELLINLHDVTAARYGIAPEEFLAWRARFAAPSTPPLREQ